MGDMVFFDLQREKISLYTFGKNGKVLPSSDTVSAPLGNDGSFAIDVGGTNGGESVLSLPLSLLNFRILELPFSDLKKIRELLTFEIDGLVLGGAENIVFDASVLEQVNGKSRVLVTYVEKAVLRPVLERLKLSGFDPGVVTSVELASVLEALPPGQGLTDLLLDPKVLTEEERREAAAAEILRPTVNLRSGEFVYTADSDRVKRKWKITALLAALVILVFLADMTMVTFALKRQNRVAGNEIRKTYLSLFPDEKRISDEVYQLKAHMKELRGKEDAFVGLSPLRVLLGLSKATRPGVALNEVLVDRDLIILKGESPSMGEVQKYQKDLEGFLSAVTISDTKPSLQNRTIFTITAKERRE